LSQEVVHNIMSILALVIGFGTVDV